MKAAENILDDIRLMYDSSPMAAAAAVNGKAVYVNDAFIKMFGTDALPVDAERLTSSGETTVFSNGRAYRAYITVMGDAALVCFSPAGSFADDTLPVLSAAVRHAASAVTAAADCMAASDDNKDDLIGTIDGTMLNLLSEFLIPEEIQLLRCSDASDFPAVSVSDAARDMADELGAVFAKLPASVSCNVSSGLYSACDIRAVTLIMTHFAADAAGGEYFPDGISAALTRTAPDIMEFTIAVSTIMKNRQILDSRALSKPSGYSPAEELMSILSGMFGISFKEKASADCISLTAEIPMCRAPSPSALRSPIKKFGTLSRFSDTALVFSRFGITK